MTWTIQIYSAGKWVFFKHITENSVKVFNGWIKHMRFWSNGTAWRIVRHSDGIVIAQSK